MISKRREIRFRQSYRFLALLLVLGGLTACEGGLFNLDVEDPDIVTPSQLEGPEAVPITVAGIRGAWRETYDEIALWAGLITDEFILAGTFPTRLEADNRRILESNTSLNAEIYEELHSARFQADQGVAIFEENLDNPDFADVRDDMVGGLAVGRVFAGYTRIHLAEMFCSSILGGGDENDPSFETAPVSPDERMQQALTVLQGAEQASVDAGENALANVARVGQARAHLWLGNFQQAANVASGVPSDFVFLTEFSDNTRAEDNEVFRLTWGVIDVVRWTVGDGTDAGRKNERYPYYDEWVALGLIIPPDQNTRSSFNQSTPVALQTLYSPTSLGGGQAADMILASGWEARMIEAEAAVRGGNPAGAAAIVNPLLANPASNPMRAINPGIPTGPFAPANFTGDLANDLREIARARAAGLWLTGERQGTLRRLLRDGVDLFPPGGAGEDTAFPITEQEIDNNPGVSQGCPTGPPWQ